MPTSIVPYDSFTCAQNTGTWTYTGSLSPAPSAPATYNGSIDFDGYAAGTYQYTYTVGTHSATVDITWSGAGLARSNDECTSATFIIPTDVSPFTTTLDDDNRGTCYSGIVSPTDSGYTKPASWLSATYGGDLWYEFVPPVCSEDYNVTIIVQGDTSTTSIYGPALEVFRNCGAGQCDTDVSIGSAATTISSNRVQFSFTVQAEYRTRIRFRVASPEDYEGKYTITVLSGATCTPAVAKPCTSEQADAWGEAANEVWGSAPDEVWG